MEKKKQYNAVYRLRKKGVKISTPEKTVYANPEFENHRTLGILIKEFHFVLQTTLF